jgi:hypothetical protein
MDANGVVNPLGIICGFLSLKNRVVLSWVAIFINILLTISFGPMWLLGDLIGF